MKTGENPQTTIAQLGIVSGFSLRDKLGSPHKNPRFMFLDINLRITKIIKAKNKIVEAEHFQTIQLNDLYPELLLQ